MDCGVNSAGLLWSGMSWIALLFAPGAHAQTRVVQADQSVSEDGILRLLRGDRVVWRGPAESVKEAILCASQKDAADACQAHREAVGRGHGATLALQESGPAPRLRGRAHGKGRTAIPAEGISVRVKE
ncbi:MAG: hypothetical protein ACI9WU_004439 [Myxococcota bacterium]|jgi:hypothetical protein